MGHVQESGLIWFKELDQYLRGTLGFTTMPIDRCLFRLTRSTGSARQTCIAGAARRIFQRGRWTLALDAVAKLERNARSPHPNPRKGYIS